MPASPTARFFDQYIKKSPKLSAAAIDFMTRLLLELDELPWKNSETIECVFEDSRGEVQVCFAKRRLRFSRQREHFIESRIRDAGYSPLEEEVLCEWVRSSSTGPWKEKICGLSIEPRDHGVYALEIETRNADWEEESPGSSTRKCSLVIASGMYPVPQEDLAEQALAGGVKAICIQFPTQDILERNRRWIAALEDRYPASLIAVESMDDPIGVLLPRDVIPRFAVGEKIVFPG